MIFDWKPVELWVWTLIWVIFHNILILRYEKKWWFLLGFKPRNVILSVIFAYCAMYSNGFLIGNVLMDKIFHWKCLRRRHSLPRCSTKNWFFRHCHLAFALLNENFFLQSISFVFCASLQPTLLISMLLGFKKNIIIEEVF